MHKTHYILCNIFLVVYFRYVEKFIQFNLQLSKFIKFHINTEDLDLLIHNNHSLGFAIYVILFGIFNLFDTIPIPDAMHAFET